MYILFGWLDSLEPGEDRQTVKDVETNKCAPSHLHMKHLHTERWNDSEKSERERINYMRKTGKSV